MRIFLKLFFFLVSPMLWAQGNPPATLPTPSGDCDPYFDGLIKQTKASVFSPIESGSNAVIYLDNSRMATGVTYFAINKTTGMWFAGSYDTTLFMVTIPVGVLTQNTTFEVHAIAGGCSFKVVDDVTFEVKPTTEVHLQTRVRDEYCDNSGGIYYQMMGDSNDNYNFYHKLSTQTAFQTATADRNDLQTVQGGKTYVIRAELKTNPTTFYEKTINVGNLKVPNPPGIEYTVTAQPLLCAPNTGRAIVNITQGVAFPFTFEITSGPVTRPEQASNVFENLPAGNYVMYVKDACRQGRTLNFRIGGQPFHIGPIGGFSYVSPTDECGRGLVRLQRGIKMSREHWYTDAIPYPMTVSYTLTSPSGTSYAMTRTFNNRTELTTYAWYDHNQESIYFGHNLSGRQNFFGDGVQIPYEVGEWEHSIQVTTACGVRNLGSLKENTSSRVQTFYQFSEIKQSYDPCGKNRISVRANYLFKDAYIVLDEAPAGFDPVAAGFTKNHRFGGKYYKFVRLDHRYVPIVSYPHLLLGDYKFTYVYADCGSELQRQITVTDLQNPVGVPNTSYFYSTYYCENQSYGIGFLETGGAGAPQKIRITSFTPAPGTSGTFAVPQEYDYDQWTTIVNGRRVLHGLPFGTYTLSALDFECQQDVVDKVVTVQPPMPDPKVRFSMATGCKVQVELYDAVGDSYQRGYYLQGYDENQARWVNMVAPNANPYGDAISDKKQNIIKVLNHNNYKVYTRYRVVELTGTVGLHSACPKVLGEYTPPSELPTLVDIVGATCGANQYEIMVVASGGTPPFTYKILSRSVGGSLDPSFTPIINTTGKFTITETDPSASYKFAVEDVCNQETKDVEIRNMTPFVITTDRTEYCQGTSATLSVPDLSLAYTYEWFREDDPSTILSHSPTLQVSNLQATDFVHKYKLRVAPKDASFTLCIPAEYEVQLMGSTASAPVLTGDATNVVLCASELDGKTSYDIRTNLFATVHNNATASGHTNAVIREISGMYPVSQDGLMALHKNMIPVLEGQTFTFTYTISNACGLEATKTATLTVKRNIKPQDLIIPNYNAFRVCDADLTNWVIFGATNFNDLSEFIKNHNAARSTDLIEFFSDPQGNTPVHQLDFTTESVKIIYYKINRADYCSSVARIRIDKLSTYKRPDGTDDPRLVDLTYDTCANGVTVQDVRARLQQIFGHRSTPKVYLIRMVGGVETSSELPDNYALTTSEVYRYRMEDGGCPSSWRNITLNFNQTNIVTQPVSHIVCSGEQVVLTALGASTSPPTAGKMIYKWFESTYNGTIGATQVHAQTLNRGEASTYTPSTASVGAKYYFVEVTVENVCNVPMYTNIVKVEVKGMTASVPTVTTLSSVQCGEDVKFTFTGVPNEEVHYTVNGVASTITLPTSGVYTHTVSAATTTQVLRVVSVSNASGCPTTPTTGNVYTVTVNDLPTPTINVVNATCGNSGSATITNYDPTLTYTFSGSGVTRTGATITGFALGTTYTMTVSNGTCTKATSFVVNTTCTIDAVEDDFGIVEANTTTTGSILDNDKLGTASATTADVDIKNVVSPHTGITINTTDGKVNVANNVPSGVYTLTYTICEKVNGTPCDTATVSITVKNINADNDDFEVSAGGNTGSVLNNDKYDGEFLSSMVSVTLTPIGTLPSGISLDPITGIVRVASGTPSGNYSFNYKICSKVVTSLCDDATVTVTVQNGIVAADDDLGAVVSGGTTTQTVISNDKLNGTPVVIGTGTGQVTLTPIITPTGITLDGDGKVSVGNNVPSGVYTLTYKICENGATPDNCDEATVTITVENSIVADNDDLGSVVSGGTTTQTVISNDKLNGTPVVIGTGTGEVTLTPIITPTGITIDATNGKVTVGTNVSSGVYTLTYKICENGATPDNCDDATVTITVENGIVAEDDDLGPVVSGGTTTQTVISNDKLNGTLVVIGAGTGEVTLTPIITPTGITLNGDGKVSVGNNVPSGVYTLTYKICENGATPDNCDDATVTITVQNGIVADNDDLGPVVSGGTTTQTVISNDKLNGTPVVIGTGVGQVTLTPLITPTGITIDATNGKVTVGTNVSSGVYTLTYKICENGATPDNCDNATVTITVENSIVADNDDLGTVVSGGTTTQTVISNDKLNGTPVVIGGNVGQVTLTPLITPTGITIDATNGKVSVGNNVPSGVYTLTYKICENGATPDNCDDATVTITVENSIVADDDDLGPVVSGGTTTQTVISNDKLNGTPVVIGTGVGQVTLTPLTTPTGITIDATNGKVTVGTNVSSGVYTLTYKICENGSNPLNCDDATVTITVQNGIVAEDDNLGTVVSGGTTTQTVISNDKLNGTSVVIGTEVGQVTLTPLITPTGITIDATNGKVTVGTNVSSGVYTLTYKICENGATPDNCDHATVTITVENSIVADEDDLGTVVSGGTTTQTVITNDRLNGTPVVIGTGVGQVTLTPIITPTGITIDATNGKVTVGTNVSSGVYTLTYKICENGATPDNCDDATVTVTVENSIVADEDDLGTVVSGGTTTQTVITNDRLNGTPVVIGTGVGQVTLTPIITPTGITIDATNGKVTVGTNVSSGVYTLTYKICENGATPDNCDDATVTVTVENGIVAEDDDLGAVVSGGTTTQTVTSNDKLNGTPVVIGTGVGQVTLTPLITPTGITIDATNGKVTVGTNVSSGVYTLTYKICENGSNPLNCDDATVTVTVIAPSVSTITANSDTFTSTIAGGETVGSVFTNDDLNGLTPNSGTVSVTLLTDGGLTGVVINTDGKLLIPSTTATETKIYTLTYSICEKDGVGNATSNCANSTIEIVIPVVPSVLNITANTDTFTVTTSTNTQTVGNVLDNDRLGTKTPTTSDVTITVTSTPTGTIVPNLDPVTGNVTVPSGTPTGTYVIGYEICTKVGTITCDTATVVITVTAVTTPTVITATDDPVTVTTTQSGTVVNVLDNDKIGTNTPTTSDVTITVTSTPTGTIVPNLDPSTGNVMVLSGTPTGTYTIGYSICTKSGTITCDTATVTVIVTAVTTPTVIMATDDPVTVTTTQSGTVVNVLDNDRLGTNTPTTSDVTITVTSTPTGTIVPNLDAVTGNVTVPSGTPTGTYTIGYSICTKSATITCDTATVTVVVTEVTTPTTPVVAKDDVEQTVVDTPVTVKVVSNDEHVPTQGTLTIVTQPKNGTVVINNNGTTNDPSDDEVVYTPNRGYAGVDSFEYELCDTMGNCSIAKVTITVLDEVIPYNAISVNGDGLNDYFHIQGIERYPNNTVRIYNRWGVKVFETKGYDNVNRVFRAISNGRVTIEAPEKLPQGTYYYIIEYIDNNNKKHTKGSWLYIKK
ncbi:gliding motility-associated C-terminal domain-containing protein [Capnocytophaga canis]|uniref:T9SS type B sorting domain-containing protein n=2 Tax=Capnocytophaga canis TaxID=1848903 RepID=UPI001561AEC6|nr:gliding motility-associated C-terminal domain-containing protein [Capnocytophaga canis]